MRVANQNAAGHLDRRVSSSTSPRVKAPSFSASKIGARSAGCDKTRPSTKSVHIRQASRKFSKGNLIALCAPQVGLRLPRLIQTTRETCFSRATPGLGRLFDPILPVQIDGQNGTSRRQAIAGRGQSGEGLTQGFLKVLIDWIAFINASPQQYGVLWECRAFDPVP